MPNHKQIRRRASPDFLSEALSQQIRCAEQEKLSALHASATCSSSISNDKSRLGPLFLLADQVMLEKEVKHSNDQNPRRRETSLNNKSRTHASKSRGRSSKGPKESVEAHSGRSSHESYACSSMPNVRSELTCVSTHESGTYDSVVREKTVDTGAVSFDSSTDDHKHKDARERQVDSLVPKTVTIKKEKETRLVSSSSSEVAADTTEPVLAMGDSSELSELEALSISAARKRGSNFVTAPQSKSASLQEKSSISATIEEEVDGKAILVPDIKKRRLLSPDEISITESISYRSLNRSAYVTGTAVKKLCEKRGWWITGQVADCEVATSVIGRVQFDVDGSTEDNLRIRSTPKDLELLEKMVKLGRVRTGARVTIFRPEDDSFCPAMVLEERLQNRKAFFVQFDDGESEWINLWFHKFEVLEDAPSRKKPEHILTKTVKHASKSKDTMIKKAKSEMCAKRLESLNTTNSRGMERLTTQLPDEVRDSLDPHLLQEGAKDKTVYPVLVNERDEVKRVEDEKSDSCIIHERNEVKTGESRKDKAESSCDRSANLNRKRGRDGVSFTKSEGEDGNAILSLTEKDNGRDRDRKAGRSKVKNSRKPNTETAATGNLTSNDETSPESGPEKSEIEPFISCSMETKPADELDSESNDIDFSPPKASRGTRFRTKGKRFDSDLCDTDSMKSSDSKVEDTVTKSNIGGDSEVAVGARLGIYWEGDKKYYYGRVTKHQKGKKKPFYVEYDDGDSEWIDFSKRTYRFEKKKKIPATPQVAVKSSPSVDVMAKSKLDKTRVDAPPVQPPPRVTRKSIDAADNGLHIELRRKRSIVIDGAPSTRKKRKVTSDYESSDSIAQEVAQIKVGTRVAVWWPGDRKYYEGVVSRKQPEASWRPFFLEYDDGEEEWIDFRQHKFKILPAVAKEEHAVSSAGKTDSTCSDPSKVWIGSRLSVWWPREEEYFDCTVTRYRDHKRSLYLEYEDGDREWIDLSEHKFFIVENGPSKGLRTGKRTRAV